MPDKRVLFVAPATTVTAHFPRLKELGYDVGQAESLRGALADVEKARPQVIFSKARLPGYKVESLLGASAEAMGAFPPVVVFADKGSADEARKLLELGAKDYWLEPVPWEKIEALLPKTREEPQAASRPAAAPAPRKQPKPGADIIGKHPSMLRVLALAKQVAPSKATVLISGESGTGKEKFARFLHEHSDRAGNPFIAVNCAALPEHLLESELFGHEKGAFTGAISRKLGKFELAQGGTILLDEISEMDVGLQAKLLRVLQEGEVDRVGGTETVSVDARVLATTNRNLEEYVEEGRFRQDLYFRLNVIPLRLPPLSERGEDVLLLARFFVDTFQKAYGLPRLEFSEEARSWMLDYEWPGNVRELQNLMERAVLLAGKGPIQTSHFLLDPDSWEVPEEFGEAGGSCACETGADEPGPESMQLPEEVERLDEMEKLMILRSLDKTSGNRTQAAETLGISVRTLRNKLNEYRKQGIDIP
ncbi:sigma-54 dependent transcriptional regulator [Desulfohalovibrio reitneri]|uniref:sigma-54 dependent transcriptional regulator n=1 Tax=Desulfohalovibrio reitneri TaxID=1307759 RepID=UPI0004A72A3E|nr:sigma-54 dependent transcriptional regulator [Desulfohalovibrio reitneri]